MGRVRRARPWLVPGIVGVALYSVIFFTWPSPGWEASLARAFLANMLFFTFRNLAGRWRHRNDPPPLMALPRMPGQAAVRFSCGHWAAISEHLCRQGEMLRSMGVLSNELVGCLVCGRKVTITAARYYEPREVQHAEM